MLVQPRTVVDTGDGSLTLTYASPKVTTTVNGRTYTVGHEYTAGSIAEVIGQAYLNALVKQMRVGLAHKLSVACACDTEPVSVRVREV